MIPDDTRAAPMPTLRRLPSYLRVLHSLRGAGRDTVSCTHIAQELNLDPTQVRKDLAVTGIVGRPRIGYDLRSLIQAVEGFLGWDNVTDAFLVGVGNLGSALLGYHGFDEYGLNVVAGFDTDSAKVGTQVHGKRILHVDDMHELARRMHVHIGILTVPAQAAQSAVNYMILSGLRAIWNFTPTNLQVPAGVVLENVELSASLAVLSSKLAETLRANSE